jgi:ABC-type glycerol-3-phosphate transport system permease component
MFITKRLERIPEMENQLSVSPKTQTRDLPFWRRKSFQQTSHKVLVYTLLFGLSIIVLMPMSWMITAALRPRGDLVYTIPPQWFPTTDFHFENFWLVLINKQFPLLRPTLNTLLLIVLNIAGVLVSNTLVAYGFAHYRFPWREKLFQLVVLTMLIPGMVLMIPSFLLFLQMGWYNTYLPLWVPAFFGSPFFIFITRQYMRSVPPELLDAARIDGAGVLGTYWHIILPLCKPVLVVMTVFTFQGVWNDFVGPLLYVSDEAKFTLPIALAYFRAQSTHAATQGASSSVHLLMAGTVLVAIPPLLLYFFVQKRLIGGIARLGLKG